MPTENRQQSVTDFVDQADPDLFNAFQDRLEMLVPMTESIGAIGGVPPTSLRGATWLYQQFAIAASTTQIIDASYSYWGPWRTDNTPSGVSYHDWRYRPALLFVVKVAADNELPNGAAHDPTTIAAADCAWVLTCFRDEARTWKPFAAWDLHIYADNDGGLYVANTNGVNTYRFYIYGLISKPLSEETLALHRVKSMADYARFSAAYYNTHQDRAVMLWEASAEEGALPATFLGATSLYGEFTSAAGADTLLDDSRDWRQAIGLMHMGVVNAADRLPSGVNHDPDNIDALYWQMWCCKAGVAIGGPFGAPIPAWAPVVNFHIYADNADGKLYASNDTGADIHFYMLARMTAAIA